MFAFIEFIAALECCVAPVSFFSPDCLFYGYRFGAYCLVVPT
jgi:hypothetical protein